MSMGRRIYLSIADVGQFELEAIREVIKSGWVTAIGPDLTQFEIEVAKVTNRKFAVALNSGTAALHLAYKAAEIRPDDEVIVPSMTFAATAFPVTYLGARPIFIDIDRNTLTIDVTLLHEFLILRQSKGRLPKAIVPVDLYGTPCDYSALEAISREFEIPLICDAAESLGSEFEGRPTGSFGSSAVLSFNGNKIITTSGGGMFLTDDSELANKVRYWASQARDPVPWYEHQEVGFNYRLSNVLAALGRAQLARLPELVAKRRQIRSWYTEELDGFDGVQIIQDPPWGQSNAWLSTAIFDLILYPEAPTNVIKALEQENIESRYTWKPMHQQPVFRNSEFHSTGSADAIFSRGICLPSGSGLCKDDIKKICGVIRKELNRIKI